MVFNLVVIVLLFLFYSAYCVVKKNEKMALLLALIFIFLSVLLRINVRSELNKDYDNYLSLLSNDFTLFDSGVFKIFSEPYYYASVQFFNWIAGGTDKMQLEKVYQLNFVFSTLFYLWLARISDIHIWKKIFLFSFTYFLFTYTAIRNSVAYYLVTILFYEVQREGVFRWAFLAFLAHISALPVLLISFFKNRKPSFWVIFSLVTIAVLGYTVGQSIESFSFIFQKLDEYSEYSLQQNSIHKIYFYLLLAVTLFLLIIDSSAVFNNIYIGLFVVYVILFMMNPVLGFRFSFYLILYLIVYPGYKNSIFNKVAQLAIPLFVGLLLFSFLDMSL